MEIHRDVAGLRSITKVFLFLVIVMAITQVSAAVINITQGSTSGYTMTDGNTYIIQDSVTFSNSTAGGSGISVEDEATVVIFVPSNVTLTAIGANGSGQIGGGAGIRVPETATLVITGEGTINATGGNAGNGRNGSNGSNGGSISCRYGDYPKKVGSSSKGYGAAGKGNSGAGGSGGSGGGGAGTAIGGCGGSGGAGGVSGAAVNRSSYVLMSGFCGNGNAGASGTAGSNGSCMGVCYVLGQTTIVATGGNAGTAGNAGGFADWTRYFYDLSSGTDYYFATCGGGGGGGGGGGSSPACSIGGGGASGGGGGGGGSGATAAENDYAYQVYPMTNAHGGGGSGGMSNCTSGKNGSTKEKTRGGYYNGGGSAEAPSYYYGGDGGAGGAAGAMGDAGTLYVSPTATVNVERETLSATTHAAAQYAIAFDANGGQLASSVGELTATLGCALPDCIPTPTRRGYLFDGWNTSAGDQFYDALGTKSITSYPLAEDVVLYAQWRFDEAWSGYTITTPEPVPYSYFDIDYPALLAAHGSDYEEAALATAMNGHDKVWECYVSGVCPTNVLSRFMAKIEMRDDRPIVTWEPDLNTNEIIRTYKIYGSETLEGGGVWQYPTNSLHRFFKVTVEMP